jgi:hypothetical protein
MVRRVAHPGLVLLLAAAALTGGCSRLTFYSAKAKVPSDWKVSTDPSGSCQVTTPPDWQLGREFSLKREPLHKSQNARTIPGVPPAGLALWGIDGQNREKLMQMPAGKRYQLRTYLLHGDDMCSLWRIKGITDFTAEEKTTMAQISQTLRWVH